ncbi:histidine phosphatase family protein [Rhizobium sp.]
MPSSITLLCHGRTTQRPSAFAADGPLAQGEAERIAALVPRLGDIDIVLTSPAQAARQTAEALSVTAIVDMALGDLDIGRWRGQTLRDIEAAGPEMLAIWMEDMSFAGHGGESRNALRERVASWLDQRAATSSRTLAITHPAVIQSAMLAILGAPASAFRHIDVPPLHALDVRGDGRRWTIRSFGGL